MPRFARTQHKPTSKVDTKAFDIIVVFEVDGYLGNIGGDNWVSLQNAHIYTTEEIKQLLEQSVEGV